MKKLLITSTALVLVAGAAAAEVKVGGNGRMGVVYNGEDWNFSSRIRASFTMSGETDGGLQFGGSFRVDQEDDPHNGGGTASLGSAGSIWVSGAWGKLSMGDVVGAAEAALFDLPEVGFTDIAANDVFYLTGDGNLTANNNPVALYEYSSGDLSFYASFNDGKVSNGSVDDDQEYALGLSYNFGNYSVGVGYEILDPAGAGDSLNHIIIGGSAAFGDTTVQAFYGQVDYTGGHEDKHFGIGAKSKFNALTVSGFVQKWDEDSAFGTDATYFGLGAAYDLGGGASVVGGVGSWDDGDDTTDEDVTADLGLKFTF